MKKDFLRLIAYYFLLIILIGLVVPMGKHWFWMTIIFVTFSYAIQRYFNKHLKDKK